MQSKNFDLTIIGGGIVGIATAWKIKNSMPHARILVLEKEKELALHQTGHNSGVIHAGVYYQPGSLKADFCRRGAMATFEFCRNHNIEVEQCGKLLVATDEKELLRMSALEERCVQNQIETIRLSADALSKKEPAIKGLGALFVPATGITDYRKVTRKMAECFIDLGGVLQTGSTVTQIAESADSVAITTPTQNYETSCLIVCGGLMADRLASMTGIDIDFRIIPFRGEYYQLPQQLSGIINHLIYPIPDPELPFLGVHLTKMVDGALTVGPNAVLGWKREGYGNVNINLRDIFEMLTFGGFWKVMKNNLGSGFSEIRDSLLKSGYLKRVQKYCPQIQLSDLLPYPAGVRAQAVKADGTLVHDFLFSHSPRTLHVCNAPSPAATSAVPIAEYLTEKAAAHFSLN